MRNVVFVVGMHRSGSSALARTLALCGGALPLEMLPENFGNPSGYWEPVIAMRLNDEFLVRHGSAWDDPDPALQVRPIASAERTAFIARLAAFLDAGFAPAGPPIVKEPRISVLLPYWIEAAQVAGQLPHIVHVFRNPVDTVASLRTRDELDAGRATTLWLKYNLFGERDGRGVSRSFVAYEDLLDDWERATTHCLRRIGLGSELQAGPAERAGIGHFLRPELRHHANGTTESDRDALGELAGDTYRVLSEASGRAKPAAFNELRARYVSLCATGATAPPSWSGAPSKRRRTLASNDG